jgi:hypothetical protein
MSATAAATAGIGHNHPPSVTEQVHSALSEKHRQLTARTEDLLGSVSRAPQTVDSEETAGRVADLIRMIGHAGQKAEAERKAEKEPHLEGGRAVDAWFKRITDPLAEAKARLQKPLDAFLKQKAAAERDRREAEARALKEAAEREAAQMQTPAQMDAAIAIEARAQEVQQSAQARPAELARTRGDYGGVATLRTVWKHEVTDPSLVPREFLVVNDAAIKAAIKGAAKPGELKIPGVRIFEDSSAVVR